MLLQSGHAMQDISNSGAHSLLIARPWPDSGSCAAQVLYPIGKVTQGVSFDAPMPDLATFRPEGMRMEMLRAEGMPGSKGLTRLHFELRLPCPVWGAMNVTGPVKAWSLAAEPSEVRVTSLHKFVQTWDLHGKACKCHVLFITSLIV